LIPFDQNDRYAGTATIEEEAYNQLRAGPLNTKVCPITRVLVKGYVRNMEMEKIVTDYLTQYPDEKAEQYTLSQNLSVAVSQSSTNQSDVTQISDSRQNIGILPISPRNRRTDRNLGRDALFFAIENQNTETLRLLLSDVRVDPNQILEFQCDVSIGGISPVH